MTGDAGGGGGEDQEEDNEGGESVQDALLDHLQKVALRARGRRLAS